MTFLQRIKLNPWLVFSPFALLYLLIVITQQEGILKGDAGRYLANANELLQGDYTHLWNSPGYPLLLTPFIWLKLPYIIITILNAVFRYLSNVFLYKTIIRYTSATNALLFSLFWAANYSTYKLLSNINTESFTIFLITMIGYYASLSYNLLEQRFTNHQLIFGVLIGFLVLTKAIFGYVLLVSIFLSVLYYFLHKQKIRNLNTILILLIAFLINTPYLLHTYRLTGRMFYWASSGGMSLYWMSTPYEWEYGDWQSANFNAGFAGRDTDKLKGNHQQDYDKITQLGTGKLHDVKADSLYKEMAKQNIARHPKKYIINWIANISRLFFGFPNSFQRENLKPYKYLPPNLIIITLSLYSLTILFLNLAKTHYEIKILLIFIGIYLFFSTLVSTEPRMFLVICPVILFWLAYTVHKTIKLNFFFEEEEADKEIV